MGLHDAKVPNPVGLHPCYRHSTAHRPVLGEFESLRSGVETGQGLCTQGQLPI